MFKALISPQPAFISSSAEIILTSAVTFLIISFSRCFKRELFPVSTFSNGLSMLTKKIKKLINNKTYMRTFLIPLF